MSNIANAHSVQEFDFSNLNCIGMDNCNSDQSSDTMTITIFLIYCFEYVGQAF